MISPYGALWAELTPHRRVIEALPTLAARSLRLHLAWPVGSEADEAGLPLVRAGLEQGVEVKPWLLLPRAQGYWAGADNAAVFAEAARHLALIWANSGLPASTLIVDMEPPLSRTLALERALSAGGRGWLRALRLLAQGVPEAQMEAARAIYGRLIDDLHRRGWRVHLTTLPFVVDDPDARGTLARALGLPMQGLDWDVVSLQVYRTMFDDALGPLAGWTGFGPELVHRYGQKARDAFGERAGLDVGLVDQGVVPSARRYLRPAELGADLEAAQRAGLSRDHLAVYNLKGLLDRMPLGPWLDPPGPRRLKRDLCTTIYGPLVGLTARALSAARVIR